MFTGYNAPYLTIIEEQYHHADISFPYIPGLLSFREGPLFLDTYQKLTLKPDCIMFDGQGVAHPRKFGIASHMGLWLDIPSIGCAKSKLYGTNENPGETAGCSAPLADRAGEKIGVVYRTKNNVKPVFISPGHRVGFDDAVAITAQCTGKFRLPLPTRIADMKVGEYKRRAISDIHKKCNL
ncbi:MAG TPA: endonuclease V [Spirochaetota bacterium]|nr:endonuclease V [Spirochaetota bacterium]